MAGTIIVSDIKTDTDNSFVVRANTGNVLFRVTDTGLDTANSIPAGSITSGMIADGTVIAADVANGTITTAKIADANVTTAKIADDAVNAAKLNVSGNGDSGQALLSDGDGSFSWGSAGASGAESIVLNSGSPSATLTAANAQVQFVFTDTAQGAITMPDATTLTKGDGTFVFYNPSGLAVALKDNGGTIREYLSPNSTTSFKLKDNSTSNGVWVLDTPVLGGYSNITTGTALAFTANVSGDTIKNICKVNDTQYLIISVNQSTAVMYAKLLTVNISTKAVTWGNSVTLATVGQPNYNYLNVGGDSNGVDKGIINYSTSSGGNYYELVNGFAIVSGTLYISSVQTIYSAGSQRGASVTMYCGSNDAFLVYGGEGENTGVAKARGAKVTVSGTTVTTTLSAATYTSISGPTVWAIAPTSLTSLVVDNTVNTIKDYVNYVPSTNTLTSGARTTQTSIIVGSTLNAGIMAPAMSYTEWFADRLFTRALFNGRKSLITNTAGTKIFWLNKILNVANPGTASVTVSLASYTSKPYLAPNYATNTTLTSGIAYGEGGFTDSLTVSATDIRLLDNVQSSKNVVYQTDANPLQKPYTFLHKVDPSVSTFNLNYGSQALINYSLYPYWAFYLSNGNIIAFNLPNLYSFSDGTLDIFTAATIYEG